MSFENNEALNHIDAVNLVSDLIKAVAFLDAEFKAAYEILRVTK